MTALRGLQLLFTGFLAAAPGMALWMAAGPAGAQTAAGYPSKPVRIILPYAPGGSNDPVMSLLSQKFNKDLGQAFVVDARGGGDTVVGTTAAVKSAADGYTLLMHTSTLLVNHWLYPNLEYNVLRDFAPISGVTRSESLLIAHPSVPARDLNELIAYAKGNPGAINAATSSPLVLLHFQRFMNATGTRLTIVPYKGGGPIMNDLLGGTVHLFLSSASTVPGFVMAGKLKAFATSGAKRNAQLPEVPTFAEAGVKDYEPNNWLALFAPAKTPRDIIEKLNSEVRRAEETPDVAAGLVKLGVDPFPTTVTQLEQFVATEADRFGKLVKDAGLKAGDY